MIEREVISHAEMAARLPPGMHYLFTIVLTRRGETFVMTASGMDGEPAARARDARDYFEALVTRLLPAERASLLREPEARILFQGADDSISAPSLAFQAHGPMSDVTLIPDPFYFAARGYESDFPSVPAWRDRKRQAIWRGSSTGKLDLRLDELDELPRYRLCRMARDLGDVVDAGLIAIVQAATPEDDRGIVDRCRAEGLFADFVQMSDMASYRMLIDIDGNTNAWNAIARYRTGCCVLRVETPWRQWYHDRIQPWEHFVPVAADLSDLGERIDWCLRNEAEAAAIGWRGRDLATGMRFDGEMDAASTALARL